MSNQSWIDLTINHIVDNDIRWAQEQPNGQNIQKCTSFEKDTGLLHDEICSLKGCFTCQWNKEPVLILRGLGSHTNVDTHFVLTLDLTYDENLFFTGFENNNLLFNKDTNSWLIVEDLIADLFKQNVTMRPKKVVGILESNESGNQLPIGRQLWNLTNFPEPILLKLTSVSVLNF